jgi:predicted nucleotidyltransferase
MTQLPFSIPSKALGAFCRRNHIRRLAVFGSALRSDVRPESDIDLLVEFDLDHVPGFLRLARMEREMSELFGGRKVDLRTPDDLSRYFRADVLANARIIYERS